MRLAKKYVLTTKKDIWANWYYNFNLYIYLVP